MTLVQVAATSSEVHFATDFRLTDPDSRLAVSNDAHKLVYVSTLSRFNAYVAVTGLGVFEGQPVAIWIERVAAEVDAQTIDQLAFALRVRADPLLARVSDSQLRKHAFVLGGVEGGSVALVAVANYLMFDRRGRLSTSAAARGRLSYSRRTVTEPTYVAVGDTSCLPATARTRVIDALTRGEGNEAVQNLLAEINVECAATKTDGTVSKGCFTASIHRSGGGEARPHLTSEQQSDFIPPGLFAGMPMSELIKSLGLRPKLDSSGNPMPIRLRGGSIGRWVNDEKWIKEEIDRHPDDAETWSNLGSFYRQRGRHPDAITSFDHALSLDPNLTHALLHRGLEAYQHEGDSEAAKGYIDRALNSTERPDGFTLLSAAEFYSSQLEDREEARRLLEQAVLQGDWFASKITFAKHLYEWGVDLELADRLYSESIEAHPNDGYVLREVATINVYILKAGDLEAARSACHKLCSGDDASIDDLGFAADACIMLHDGPNAARYLRRLLRAGRDSPGIRFNLGIALLMARKFRSARLVLAELVSAAPEMGPAAEIAIAAALWADDQRGAAVKAMRLVRQHGSLQPDDELELLAMMHLAEGLNAADTHRFKALVESGASTLVCLVRFMARDLSADRRKLGIDLADVAEGKAPLARLGDPFG